MKVKTESGGKRRILILTVSHGAAHFRAARAIEQALSETESGLVVEVADALEHCAGWFRRYYNSYEIPLRYWPALWGWIEGLQHKAKSTGPGWLYRRGAQPLFRFVRNFNPDAVVTTEVGVCELVSLFKRESRASFQLTAVELMDFYPAWVRPEVDLYLVTHEDLGQELTQAGAPPERIVSTGQPIDPIFAALPQRQEARARLSLQEDLPLVLALFGGAGFGKPLQIFEELKKVRQRFQAVFVAGKNERLENKLQKLCAGIPHARGLGWVTNLQDWMVAADLMVSKPGGNTLAEGLACGLPMLAFDPLPGNEQRTCAWIEKWKTGWWVRRAEDLAPAVENLLANPAELQRLRDRARALARPRAAYDAARAILAGH